MDKKRSLINVIVAIAFKFIILILSLLSRRFLIKYVGNDANGICSLYTSIIGFLAIADLGIGVAITYCMYEPIINKDNVKVAALYQLFIKIYRIIGLIILAAGLCLMPFLSYLVKEYEITNELYYDFIIMLIGTVLTYFYSAQSSLINAYKNNYVTTTITSIGEIARYIFEIIVLVSTRSFTLFFVARIISSLIQFVLTEIYSRHKYNDIIKIKAKIDDRTKRQVTKNVGAMFAHKIGGLLSQTIDSIIISSFISVTILGKYSNYTTLIVAMNGIIILFFTPLTSIIGHLCVKADKNEIKNYYLFFYLFNFVLGIIFYLGYYGVINDLILICFGSDLELDFSIVFVLTTSYFTIFLRQSMNTFRDATGAFYYDRFKPLVEGILNLILSLILVHYIGVVGVTLATIISNLVVCDIVEPYVLYKYVFDAKPTKYYILNYGLILVFVVCLYLLHISMLSFDNVYLEFLVNGCIAVAIALVPTILIIIFNKDFRNRCFNLVKGLLKIKKN